MKDYYFLTVAYKIDQYKKHEDAIKIYFMWVPLSSSPPYTMSNDDTIRGKPTKVFLTPNTKEVILYVGKRKFKKDGSPVEESPIELEYAFRINLKGSESEELELQFTQSPKNKKLSVLVLNREAEVDLDLTKNEKTFHPLELPSELPQLPTIRYQPMRFIWVIDGTVTEKSFKKCINIATLFSDEFGRKAELEINYYIFGEYPELHSWNNSPSPQGAYTLIRGDFTSDIKYFKNNIRTHYPLPGLIHDDPAAALEYALREIAESVENNIPKDWPIWIFVFGNSLPHYKINELRKQAISIIPTEEFHNIDWNFELKRLLEQPHIYLQPIWVDDEHDTEYKWTERDLLGHKIALNEAKMWWFNKLGLKLNCIELSRDINPSGMLSILQDTITKYYPGHVTVEKPSLYPLRYPLGEIVLPPE